MRVRLTVEERIAWLITLIGFAFLVFWCVPKACGATYYVSKAGDDLTGSGSAGSPWLTVQKAANSMTSGDTVIVAPGNYVETVTTKAHGTAENRITFKAQNPKAGAQEDMSILRAIRVQHSYHIFDGFHVVRGGADLNQALVRIEKNAGHLILTNNVIRDSLLTIATNCYFGSNFMVSVGTPTFTNFEAGDRVFLGADSHNWHTNHDIALTVLSSSADTLYFTNLLSEDYGSNYWAPVYAGGDNSGYKGVLFDNTGGSASNVIVRGNIISNVFGSAMQLTGDGHLVEDNAIAGLKGRYAFRLNASNTQVRRNLIHAGKNLIWFTAWELLNIEHPAGGDWFDYQANVMDCQPVAGVVVTNVLLERNWFQDLDNQAGLFTGNAVSSGMMLRSNVFVGIAMQGGGSMDGLIYERNTFYRVGYDQSVSLALGLGGLSDENHQTGLVVSNNVFIDVGSHYNRTLEGSYGIVEAWTDSPVLTNNYAAGPETTGWETNSEDTEGITWKGGDPLFVNAADPLGPDDLPFTEDDGLRPLPNSPLAVHGLGALEPLGTSEPIAHFVVAEPLGWHDTPSGTNYDSAWVATLPGLRGGTIRPWTEPEALGHVPVMVTFNAAGSIDGTGTNNAVIRYYGWDFGDGQKAVTVLPVVSHTYLRTGVVAVALSVTNYYGGTDSYTNTYKLLAQTNGANIYWVSTNGNNSGAGSYESPWLTLNKAADVVAAGDYVGVLAGAYPETVDITTAGTESAPVRWIGYGASVGDWNVRVSHQRIEGFWIDYSAGGNGGVYCYQYTTNLVMVNNRFGPTPTHGVRMGVQCVSNTNLPSLGPQNHSISNCVFVGVDYIQITWLGRGHRAQGNIFLNSQYQADLVRPFGENHVFCDNFASGIAAVTNNHADIFQVFGTQANPETTSVVVTNIVIERNTVLDSDIAICQLEEFDNLPWITNIFFRNNIVANTTGGGSVDVPGVKFYNNLFYRVAAGAVIVWGGVKGDAYGAEVLNNVFFECGNGSASGAGWYGRMEDQSISNYSLLADYNFVCGTNGLAKDAAPPDSSSRWGSSGGTPPNTWEVNGVNGGDPQFVGAASADFRITTNSILYGAGTNLYSLFTTDLTGAARQESAAWSIGPYEPAEAEQPEGLEPGPVFLSSARAIHAHVGRIQDEHTSKRVGAASRNSGNQR